MIRTILLADDSLTIQKVVELTFADTDYNVVAVSSGEELLQRIVDSQPDLIICDVIMPGKDGYDVCQQIKSDPTTLHIPVILLTGTFEPFDRDRALAAGCSEIVTKPFEARKLVETVESLLQETGPEGILEEGPIPGQVMPPQRFEGQIAPPAHTVPVVSRAAAETAPLPSSQDAYRMQFVPAPAAVVPPPAAVVMPPAAVVMPPLAAQAPPLEDGLDFTSTGFAEMEAAARRQAETSPPPPEEGLEYEHPEELAADTGWPPAAPRGAADTGPITEPIAPPAFAAPAPPAFEEVAAAPEPVPAAFEEVPAAAEPPAFEEVPQPADFPEGPGFEEALPAEQPAFEEAPPPADFPEEPGFEEALLAEQPAFEEAPPPADFPEGPGFAEALPAEQPAFEEAPPPADFPEGPGFAEALPAEQPAFEEAPPPADFPEEPGFAEALPAVQPAFEEAPPPADFPEQPGFEETLPAVRPAFEEAPPPADFPEEPGFEEALLAEQPAFAEPSSFAEAPPPAESVLAGSQPEEAAGLWEAPPAQARPFGEPELRDRILEPPAFADAAGLPEEAPTEDVTDEALSQATTPTFEEYLEEPGALEEPSAHALAERAPIPAARVSTLSDEDVDRIARRVLELSRDALERIAWEIIPDMAEVVIRERIRQLEEDVEAAQPS